MKSNPWPHALKYILLATRSRWRSFKLKTIIIEKSKSQAFGPPGETLYFNIFRDKYQYSRLFLVQRDLTRKRLNIDLKKKIYQIRFDYRVWYIHYEYENVVCYVPCDGKIIQCRQCVTTKRKIFRHCHAVQYVYSVILPFFLNALFRVYVLYLRLQQVTMWLRAHRRAPMDDVQWLNGKCIFLTNTVLTKNIAVTECLVRGELPLNI